MATDVIKLANDGLSKIKTATEYITKVSHVATDEQKKLAKEVAEDAQEKIHDAMQKAKSTKSAKSSIIKLKNDRDRFDTSYVTEPDYSLVINTEVDKVLKFINKYATKEEVMALEPEVKYIANPADALLLARNAQLQLDLAQARVDLGQANDTIDELRAELLDTTNRYNAVVARIRQLVADMRAIRQQLRDSVRESARHQANLAIRTGERDVAQAALAQANADLVNARRDLQQARDALVDAQRDLARVTAERDRARNDLAQAQADLATRTGEKKQLESDLAIVRNDLAGVRNDLAGVNNNLQIARADLARANQSITDLTNERNRLAGEKKDALGEIDRLKQAALQDAKLNADNAAEIVKLQAQITTMSARIQTLSDSENKLNDALKDANAANAKLTSDNQQLEAKNRQLEAKYQQLETKNQQLEAKNQQLESERKQLDADKQQLEAKNRQLESDIIKLQSDISGLQTKNKQLESDIGRLQAQLVATQAQLAVPVAPPVPVADQKLQDQYDALDQQYKALNAEHTRLKKELEDKSREILAYVEKNKQLTDDNKQLTDDNKELTKQIADIKLAMSDLLSELYDMLDPSNKKQSADNINATFDAIKELIRNFRVLNPQAEENLKELNKKLDALLKNTRDKIDADRLFSFIDDAEKQIIDKLNALITTYITDTALAPLLAELKVSDYKDLTYESVSALVRKYDDVESALGKTQKDLLFGLASLLEEREKAQNKSTLHNLRKGISIASLSDIQKRLDAIKQADAGNVDNGILLDTLTALTNTVKESVDSFNAQLNSMEAALFDKIRAVSKVSNFRAEIERMRKVIGDLSDKFDALSDSNSGQYDSLVKLWNNPDVKNRLDTEYVAKIDGLFADAKNAETPLAQVKLNINANADALKQEESNLSQANTDDAKAAINAKIDKLIEDSNALRVEKIRLQEALHNANANFVKQFSSLLAGTLNKLIVENKQLERASTDNPELLKQINTLKDQLVAKDSELQKQVLEVQRKVDEIGQLEAKLETKNNMVANLTAQNQSLTDDRNAYAAQKVIEMKTKITEEYKKTIKDKETRITKIEEELKELTDSNKQLTSELNTISDQNTRLQQLLDKKANLEGELSAAKQRITELDESTEISDELNKELEAENKRLEQELTTLTGKLLGNLSDSEKARITLLANSETRRMETEYAEMKQKYNAVQNGEMLKLNNNLERQITDAKATIQGLETQLAKAVKELKDADVDKLQNDLKNVQLENEQLKKSNATLTNQVADASTLANKTADYATIVKQLQEAKKQLTDYENIKKQLQDMTDGKDEAIKEALKRKEQELTDYKRNTDIQIAALNAANADATAKIKQLTTELQRIKDSIVSKNKTIQQLIEVYKSRDTVANAGSTGPPTQATKTKRITEANARFNKIVKSAESKDAEVLGGLEPEYRHYSKSSYSGRGEANTTDSFGMEYATVGLAGAVGGMAWFGLGGLIVFLLLMLIIWFTYKIYNSQFDTKHNTVDNCRYLRKTTV